MVRHLFVIDDPLQQALADLSSALGVIFASTEIARVFSDSEADQVSVKTYRFVETSKVRVTGVVDEYEPETIWIEVHGSPRIERLAHQHLEEF